VQKTVFERLEKLLGSRDREGAVFKQQRYRGARAWPIANRPQAASLPYIGFAL